MFATNLVDCEMMNFFHIRKTTDFIAKFKILAEHIFDKCGKDIVRQKWAHRIMALQALAGDTCKTTTKRVTKPTKASMGKIKKKILNIFGNNF